MSDFKRSVMPQTYPRGIKHEYDWVSPVRSREKVNRILLHCVCSGPMRKRLMSQRISGRRWMDRLAEITGNDIRAFARHTDMGSLVHGDA